MRRFTSNIIIVGRPSTSADPEIFEVTPMSPEALDKLLVQAFSKNKP